MNFDSHEPPFYGQVTSFSAFYQASKFNHKKMVLQVKLFDFTVPERYCDRDGKQMQVLLLSRNADEFRKLSWQVLNMSPNFDEEKIFRKRKLSPAVS